MKALALLTAVAVTFFSVAASAQNYGAPYGKGKAPPPPPVVTNQNQPLATRGKGRRTKLT